MKPPGSSSFDDRLSNFSHAAGRSAGSWLVRWRRLLAAFLIACGAGSFFWPPLGLYLVAALLGYSAALAPTALVSYFPGRRRALTTTLILTLIPAMFVAWGISQTIHRWLGWVIIAGVVIAGFVQLISAQRKERPVLGLVAGFALGGCGLAMAVYHPWIEANIRNVMGILIIVVGALLLMWSPQAEKNQ